MIKPSRIIGVNYLSRWHLLPRNRFFNVYLHKFSGNDDDRAFHDHPWWSVSFLLKGLLVELSDRGHRVPRRFVPVLRKPTFSHRLVLVGKPAWTLFITGPVVREWGFWCGSRWVHWRDFTDATGNGVGKGCD